MLALITNIMYIIRYGVIIISLVTPDVSGNIFHRR